MPAWAEQAAYLEEGAFGALPPQGLRAGLVLAVLLIHLEILPLQGKPKGKSPSGTQSCWAANEANTQTVRAFISAANFNISK